jgi:hypothetical protein
MTKRMDGGTDEYTTADTAADMAAGKAAEILAGTAVVGGEKADAAAHAAAHTGDTVAVDIRVVAAGTAHTAADSVAQMSTALRQPPMGLAESHSYHHHRPRSTIGHR